MHNPKDMFGNEIREGDQFIVIGEKLVHIDAIEDYLIEVQGAMFCKREKADYSAK